jgi:hypothetical protein
MVQVKVGQRADLLTGRVEESYERRKRMPPEAQEPSSEPAPALPEPARTKPKPVPEQDDQDLPQ